MKVSALKQGFGAEIMGLDLANAPEQEIRSLLHPLILEHRLIVVRNQKLEVQQLVAFGQGWGDLDQDEPHPALPDRPEVVPISNDAAHGHLDIGHYWHADGVFQERKVRYSILYAVVVAPDGGETLFCDGYASCEQLPESLRTRIAGREAFHMNRVQVPFIVAHPETGRRSLYLSLGGMLGVRGIGLGEMIGLTEDLARHVSAETFVYRHAYRPGDVVIHDAFAVLHRATPKPQTGLRLNYRVTALVPEIFELEPG